MGFPLALCISTTARVAALNAFESDAISGFHKRPLRSGLPTALNKKEQPRTKELLSTAINAESIFMFILTHLTLGANGNSIEVSK
jgi:hypothetical protein